MNKNKPNADWQSELPFQVNQQIDDKLIKSFRKKKKTWVEIYNWDKAVKMKDGENLSPNGKVLDTYLLKEEEINSEAKIINLELEAISIPGGEIRLIVKQGIDKKPEKPEFLFFLAALTYPAALREEMSGHLVEYYNRDKERHGEKRARKLLIKDICYSVLPIVIELSRSRFIKLLKLVGLYKIFYLLFK